MVPRGFPSNKWTFGQDFTVYEPMTVTYQYFKNFVSIMSIILEGSLMLESIRRSILRKYITKLHFSNKRWSIVHIGWAIKSPRVTQAKTSMEVQATILFLPIDDGIHFNFGINVWMKINCGSNASAIEPPIFLL